VRVRGRLRFQLSSLAEPAQQVGGAIGVAIASAVAGDTGDPQFVYHATVLLFGAAAIFAGAVFGPTRTKTATKGTDRFDNDVGHSSSSSAVNVHPITAVYRYAGQRITVDASNSRLMDGPGLSGFEVRGGRLDVVPQRPSVRGAAVLGSRVLSGAACRLPHPDGADGQAQCRR
jgi:hypothetical protein